MTNWQQSEHGKRQKVIAVLLKFCTAPQLHHELSFFFCVAISLRQFLKQHDLSKLNLSQVIEFENNSAVSKNGVFIYE
jgi:hypothetical protein